MAEPIDFPTSPATGELYTSPNGDTWQWDGEAWNSASNIVGTGATTVTNILHTTSQQVQLNEEAKNTKTNTWFYGTNQYGWSQSDSTGGWNLTAPVGPAHPTDDVLPTFVFSNYVNNCVELPNAYFDYQSGGGNGGVPYFANSKDKIRIRMQMYITYVGVPSSLSLNFALLSSNCCELKSSMTSQKGNAGYFQVHTNNVNGLGLKNFTSDNSIGPSPEGIVCAEWLVDPSDYLKVRDTGAGWLLYGNCDNSENIAQLNAEKTQAQEYESDAEEEIANVQGNIATTIADIQNTQAAITENNCDCAVEGSALCNDLCEQLNAQENTLAKQQSELAAYQDQLSQIKETLDAIEVKLQDIYNLPPEGNLLMPAWKIYEPPSGESKASGKVQVAKWSLRIDYVQAAGGYFTTPQVYEPLS